eukprot:s855_g11.t1
MEPGPRILRPGEKLPGPCISTASQLMVSWDDAYNELKLLGDSFDAATFDWELTRPFGLMNRCAPEPRNGQPTCGKILAWAKEKVTSFRESIGIRACCKHVVQIAQREVDANPRASQAMREFAAIREADAEIGARRVFVKHGLAAPVELSTIDLGDSRDMKRFPWLKPSSWFQHLLSIGALQRQLVGVSTLQKMRGVLQEFWDRYRCFDEGHPVYRLERAGVLSLDRLIPFYSHSDEGRTFRDAPLFVLNVHGVIGRGTVAYLKGNKHRAPVAENSQGLNYVGNTWSTHFLIATMMKHVSTPETMSRMMSAFASDCSSLLHEGISNGTDQFWFIHLASKGDLPALAKIARFTRTFGHAPKASRSKKPCRGICWKCLAGQEQDDRNNRPALPYEDVSSNPVWEDTICQEVAWAESPSILEGLDLDDARATKFFQSDFFHNVHLGVLKSFCSSAIVSLIEANSPLACFEGLTSVEKKFERLSTMYQEYFRNRGKKPWVSELSRDLVCWPMSSVCPAAKWNKGMASTEILRFIDWFACQFLQNSDDPIMKSLAACANSMNVAVTFLYRNGLWLRNFQAKKLSDWIFCFLAHYAMLASLTMAAGKSRYPVYPKSHMVCHTALELLREAAESEWVLSPLATACQQAEDFIGKPSKVSRSTNIRQAHRSVIWRSLIKIQFCLQEAALDERGMDSYPDL